MTTISDGKLWLDCDTTPPLQSRRSRYRKPENAQGEAMRIIADHEGQIGIYASAHGGTFYGYVIRYAGKEPFFEAAPKEES